ncbi:MAG TPA: GMC family oxidoreductase N-terminal domain-containing protein [Thermoleophilaceae bacterium]|nr:GMC family oxidoreductase N-terminal domain-containing protein [Thermoleophilaceae bacterium]
MEPQLSESQREALRAFCDTIVPSIERDPDPEGFWGRKASDLGIDGAVADLVLGIPDETVRGGLLQLLDVLASQGIARDISQLSREQILRNLQLASPDAAAGVNALQGMACFLYYGAPDPETGQNPNWKVFGYPGPASPAPDVPKPIAPIAPEDGATLEADAVVVGSGSGGGVVAGTLAKAGLKVIVVEAGGYFNESDFAQLELKAYQDMYWRGGPNPTADGNITLQAGTTLGGGSVVNWQNCLRTKPWVREDWARDHGLEGLDGPDYDRHLDVVLDRISATDECSDLNGPHQRLKEGCEALGLDFRTIVRNVDRSKYTPEQAGYAGFGDQSGAKLSTDKTWILDAVERGGEVLVRTRAQRILTEGGRAAGVECVLLTDEGTPRGSITVRAPRVVVACGSLESPALLLRSGIGGPAVGRYLRLHPALAVLGVYSEDQQGWWGGPQTGLCDSFAAREDGHGYLIEGAQYAPAIGASAVPWTSGFEHKERMADWRFGATIIALIRDRGHGQVTIDGTGEAVPTYSVDDELDRRNLWHSIESITRIHHAAGAKAIVSLAAGAPMWRYGDDLDAFIARATRMPLRAGGQKLFSAHQLGSCRMGTDPQTSVANPWGELHDTPGVWIGDGSAFPTATGTNPMISIMALAHRTAEAIAGSKDEAAAREPAAATAS